MEKYIGTASVEIDGERYEITISELVDEDDGPINGAVAISVSDETQWVGDGYADRADDGAWVIRDMDAVLGDEVYDALDSAITDFMNS